MSALPPKADVVGDAAGQASGHLMRATQIEVPFVFDRGPLCVRNGFFQRAITLPVVGDHGLRPRPWSPGPVVGT
jgi:hypothetical protein